MRESMRFINLRGVINITILFGITNSVLIENFSIPGYPLVLLRFTTIVSRIYHERIKCDPKDGELCLIRLKSGETLMEDRSSSDVQIDCQNWA
jgi:hypothetical protein